MIKILIVEDEELERNAIKDLLKKKYNDRLTIFTANNGEEAVDIALEVIPDIVLIDIHMSNLNGIEASKIILETLVNVKIVILTAYDNFQYAQTSVALDIKEYLLKPVKTEKLYYVIDKQIAEIHKQRNLIKEIIETKDNLEKIKPVMKDLIIDQIVNDKIVSDALDEYLNILNLNFSNGIVYIIELKSSDSIKTYIDDEIIKDKIVEYIKEENEANNFILSGYSCHSRIVGLLVNTANNERQTMLEDRIKAIEFADNICKKIIRVFYADLKIGISNKSFSLENISNCYKQALFALNHGDDYINHYADILLVENIEYPQNIEDEILNNVTITNIGMIRTLFEKFAVNICSDSTLNTAALKGAVVQLVIQIVKKTSDNLIATYYGYDEYILEELIRSNNIDDIKHFGVDLLIDISKKIADGFKSKSNIIIDKVKTYIMQNYSNDLTLESIAEHCNISPFHLSRVFKKETNSNIFDFLTQTRIEKSKELLINSDEAIKEISINTGFNDPNYFCKVFKKSTNLTPSVFRNMNRNNHK